MKQENKLILAIFLLSGFVISGLVLAMKRYASATFVHIFEACKQTTLAFLSSPTHFIALFLFAVGILMSLIATGSFFFSILKTQAKIKKFKRSSSKKLPEKVKQILLHYKISEAHIDLVDSQRLIAFCYGIFRKKILISSGLIEKLKQKELEAVIIHEAFHLKQNHLLKLLFSKMISRILFFIPLIEDMVQALGFSIEVNTDWVVIKAQNSSRYLRKALAKSLETPVYDLYPGLRSTRWEERVMIIAGKTPLNIKPVRFSTKSIAISTSVFLLISILLIFTPKTSAATKTSIIENEDWCGLKCEPDCITEQPILSSNMFSSIKASFQ